MGPQVSIGVGLLTAPPMVQLGALRVVLYNTLGGTVHHGGRSLHAIRAGARTRGRSWTICIRMA